MDWKQSVDNLAPVDDDRTHHNQIIRIRPLEIGNMNALWQGVLALEFIIQALSEIWLDTHGLQNKDAHPNDTLFGRISFILNSIKKAEDHEVMRAI